MYTLENNCLRINIRTQGAELTSIFNKGTKIEHLWKADPAIWGWHAPILFPVVGRCLSDEIKVNGKSYKMEKHGFARNSEFQLVSQVRDQLTLRLSSSEITLCKYPYLFDLLVTYELRNTSIIQTFEVVNKGPDAMYFQLGSHPAFALPFLSDEVYEDYYIEFENDKVLDRWYINEEGFFDHRISKVMDQTNCLGLNQDMFSEDAYIFKNIKSRKATIKSHRHIHTLTVSFPQFEYLGLWAKVRAPYLCIEPWLGCADTVDQPQAFAQKEGIQTLSPSGKFQASIIISVS